MPFHSDGGFTVPAGPDWQTGAEFDFFQNRHSLFPGLKWIDLACSAETQIAGRAVTGARLVVLDTFSAYLELCLDLADFATVPDATLRTLYTEICDFQLDAGHALIRRAQDYLGKGAALTWHFSINVLTDGVRAEGINAFEGIIGRSQAAADESTQQSDALQLVVMGKTGGWVALTPAATAETYSTARFWLARTQMAFSAIQLVSDALMRQRRTILDRRQIAPKEFDAFLKLKQRAIGLLFKISPGANCASWMDSDIYGHCYKAWAIDDDKQTLLDMVDRLEGVIGNLEERRVRKNNFLLSVLINIITITGLFAVLDYFIGFSSRQGLDMAVALSVERQGALAVVVLMSAFVLFLTVRNR
ncbi:hypothetical protein HJO_06380 [Hyphomonas johnsonii MHS-2]|uniref:CorA-like Mg2+ transporter protein n=2 Tax=Hyphomonas johnsonii TaxID=81031 RepID=A0A059FS27_9PROT|nr:hypothetical protein HJO_06380 [Hyphomonas johnsonii MHS-2]